MKPDTYPSEIVTIDSLRPWPTNYNQHDDAQRVQLGASLKVHGQFRNIVIWQDYIVTGHGLVDPSRSCAVCNAGPQRIGGIDGPRRERYQGRVCVGVKLRTDNRNRDHRVDRDKRCGVASERYGSDGLPLLVARGAGDCAEDIKRATSSSVWVEAGTERLPDLP